MKLPSTSRKDSVAQSTITVATWGLSDITPRARLLWTIGLMLLALLVRLPALTDRSWWIDELITRDIGRLPLWNDDPLSPSNRFVHSKIGFCLYDKGPGPLTYMLDGLLSNYAEPIHSEYYLRIPGIVAGMAVIPILVYGLFPALGVSGTISLAATGLAAVFPIWVDWSTGARGYAWALILGLVQVCIAIGWLAERRPYPLIGLALLTLLGFFVHPFHIVFSTTVWLSLIATCWNRRAWLLIGLCILVTFVQAALILYWLHHVSQATPLGPVAGSRGAFQALSYALVLLGTREWALLLFLALLGGLGFLIIRSSPSDVRIVGWLAVFSSVSGLLLAVALTVKFFPAFRYFYGTTIPALALLALAGRRLEQTIPARLQWPLRLLALASIFWFAATAARTADTPIQNWSQAVLWLHTHAGLEDVVLTGPNSEFEVYRVYAKAAEVRAHAPLTISNTAGTKIISVQSPGAVQAILNTKRRVWFVTAFYGQHRTPEYWDLIGQNFHEKARFKGRSDILVLSNR